MKKGIFAGLVVVTAAAMLLVWVFLVQPAVAGPQANGGLEPESQEGSGKVIYAEISENLNGEDFSGGVMITFEDPPELPAEDKIAHGLFLGREGNTLSIGSGSISVEVSVEVINGEETANMVDAQHDGPTLSVVFGPDTIFYRDVTEHPEVDRAAIEAGQMTVTSVVEPGSADEIGDNMVLRIWGSRDGDQIVADVIVYEPIR